jgi:hypothetical protein
VNTRFPSRSEPMVLKMAKDRQVMYDGFSDRGAHSTKWFDVAKNFLKLAESRLEGVAVNRRPLILCPANT